jgi:hypothetical protein
MYNFTPSRWRTGKAIILIATAYVACQAQSTPQLSFDDSTPTDGRAQFKQGSCDMEPPPQSLHQLIQSTTETHTVFVDMSRTSPLYGSFVYVFYVAKQGAAPTSQICSFRVLENPSGSFVDQVADVSFHVKDGNTAEDGTIRIPVYNSAFQSDLQTEATKPFATVSLSGSSSVPIKLTNLLDLPVPVDDITATPEHLAYWQVPPHAVFQPSPPNATALGSRQSLDTGIELAVVPNRWHALGPSIFPLAREKEQETVHLNVDFHTPGGVPRTIEVPVPLRFRPSFWNLALAVCIGALIGSLLALLLPKKKSSQSPAWYKAVMIAIGFGITAEAVTMILVNGNSEFRLFGFELDPYQLMPASLIGLLVGLKGFRSADDFLNLFKKDKP